MKSSAHVGCPSRFFALKFSGTTKGTWIIRAIIGTGILKAPPNAKFILDSSLMAIQQDAILIPTRPRVLPQMINVQFSISNFQKLPSLKL
jgi:hypothetical protein